MTMIRDCILYARYSSERQNPLSCDDQLREARRYAATQGWRVVGQYQDAAVSGTRGRDARGGWDDLLGFIERGGLRAGGIVLTWDIDRWSRDWADGMIEALRLHKLGVALADTKDGVLEQAGLAGKILLTLKVAGSAEYIDKLRRGVLRGLDAKRAAGYWTHTPPFGYRLRREAGGAVLEPDPIEAPELVSIFARMAAGASPADIARDLNRRTVHTRRRSAWTPATIRDIVRSPTYRGLIPIYDSRSGPRQRTRAQYDPGEIRTIAGRHEALVDEALWCAAQRHVHRRGSGGPGQPRPLTGTVYCGDCGRRCHVCGGLEPYRYYRCRLYGIDAPGCTSERIIRIDRLEASLRTIAASFLADTAALERAAAEAAEAGWRQAVAAAAARGPAQARVAELEHQQERLLAALYDGAAPALINERLHQVQDRLEEARAALGAAGADVQPLGVAEVVAATRALLSASGASLAWVRELEARVEIPRDGPPVLTLMGERFPLDGC